MGKPVCGSFEECLYLTLLDNIHDILNVFV